MSQVEQTADEVMDSVTGHDEMAIAQHFGKTVGVLSATDALMLGRALVFVTKRRQGLNDDDARNFAMDLTFKELNGGYFAEESEESDEPGKDEQVDELRPPISLTSAS